VGHLHRALDELRLAVLVTELERGLRDVGRRRRHDQVDEPRSDLGLGFDRTRQTPEKCAGAPRILPREKPPFGDRRRELDRLVGTDGTERGKRRRGSAPFRRAQPFPQAVLDLILHHGDPPRAQAACDGGITPDERLAIGEQPTVRRAHSITYEHAERMGIPHLRAPGRFACCALEDLRGEPTGGQRSRRHSRHPFALKLAPAHER
jgi:hypothetical protein